LCIAYLTILAWITATLYYQVAAGHQAIWIIVPLAMLVAMIAAFSLIRKKVRIA
jgi:hypothetical protein